MAALVVGYTALGEFDTAWSRMSALEQLENEVRYQQNEVFINEAYYVFAQEYESGPEEIAGNLASRQAADDQVTALLNEVTELGVFDAETYFPDSQQVVDEFTALRSSQSGTFAQLVAAYDAGDWEQVDALYAANREQSQAVLGSLDSLVVMLERERDTAVSQFPADLGFTVQGIIIGMVATMLLALWGYRQINSLTAPLFGLHDAASAIGADTFRSEIVASARGSGRQTARLALAFESLAQVVRQRDAGLKKQVADFKQELIQSRRARLRLVGKPTSKTTAGGVK